MLEAVPAGCIDIMPGVALARPLQKVFDLQSSGDMRQTMRRFAQLLPFINYSLQNIELFLQVEAVARPNGFDQVANLSDAHLSTVARRIRTHRKTDEELG